jgi:hypothetical protein
VAPRWRARVVGQIEKHTRISSLEALSVTPSVGSLFQNLIKSAVTV